ncbi:longevity assurance protein 1 [Encephalitozoon intestinalis ATCC 50506]|uniref:Longevity assurance protein 1 n=1 Tax=Encephalitozoon intestinalis (strain ATCC 50506) TaxID=876142 RepID=E0S8C8_ENCIT|nr:longevity assurance protein 1 [Encephalitozoon intestinalis ATCC 50506]ADM12066.1 longevity assurance protein 1 [Encephalitozoon intestinalis ATCC 50506]UTX45856.1 TLC domain-containing protein [Encephalitozoon intestinalis]
MRFPTITVDRERDFNTHFAFPRDIYLLMALSLMIVMVKNLMILPMASTLIKRFGMEKSLEFERKKKFSISLWKALFYSFTSIYGYFVIRSEPEAYTMENLIGTWGIHRTPSKVLFYYYLEFTYYFVELFYLFSEHMYKDFLQMVAHHIVTMLLLFLSYHKDLLRPGVIIIAIHDISDPFLEISKLINYIRYKPLATNIFICFAGVFFVSRIGIYTPLITFPICITIWEHEFGRVLTFISVLLQGLVCMHVIWFWIILKMIKKIVRKEEFEDIRSVKPQGSSIHIKCK